MLRLILVLLLALTSAPMPAGAHDGMPMPASHAMAGMKHDTDRPAPMSPQHFCVGCVPMADWDAARIVPPILPPAPLPVARIVALPLLPGEAPVPPPPRNA